MNEDYKKLLKEWFGDCTTFEEITNLYAEIIYIFRKESAERCTEVMEGKKKTGLARQTEIRSGIETPST